MPDPPADQHHRPAVARLPDEVAADRAAQLDPVTRAHLVDEVGRHLAVGQPLDREREPIVLRPRRDRIAALRLVAVLGREPQVDVLAGQVAGPPGHVEAKLRTDAFSMPGVDDLGDAPAQSPAYRCSRHGSPYMW